MAADPYTVLGVQRTADEKAIKSAYRKLAKENHPDLKPGDEEADVRFKQVQAAYDVLKKAEERRLALGEANES